MAVASTSRPPAGPPCCSRSSASSESGRTPSAAVAARSSARTASTAAGASRSTSRTRGAVDRGASDQLGVVLRPGLGLGARSRGGGIGDLLVELVTDVAHGADERLVLGAQLGAQPANV